MELEAEAEEINQSESVGTCTVIGLSFRFCLTLTIWFSLGHKWNIRFWLQFYCAYVSTYDSNFLFSLGHKHSHDSAHDSDSDSVGSENQFNGI